MRCEFDVTRYVNLASGLHSPQRLKWEPAISLSPLGIVALCARGDVLAPSREGHVIDKVHGFTHSHSSWQHFGWRGRCSCPSCACACGPTRKWRMCERVVMRAQDLGCGCLARRRESTSPNNPFSRFPLKSQKKIKIKKISYKPHRIFLLSPLIKNLRFS